MEKVLGGAISALLVAILVQGCLSPTEIRILITSDVCGRIRFPNGVKVYVTPAAQVDDPTAAPTGSPSKCTDGTLGDLYVIPSGGMGDVAVRVTADVDGESPCTSADGYAGCIVARRMLRFVPHTSLTLPINLTADCVGVKCDPASTCFDGKCFKATIDNASDCATVKGCVPTTGVCVPAVKGIGCGRGGTSCAVGTERCCQCNDPQCADVCFMGANTGCMGIAPTKTIHECDDTSDCVKAGLPGVCCGRKHIKGQIRWSVVECATDCTPPSDTIFCDPGVAGACPNGQACNDDYNPWCACQ